MPLSFRPGWTDEHPDEFEQLLADRLEHPTPPECWRAQYEALLEWVARVTPVEQIEAPTLVVHGDADRIVPYENGVELARRIPGSRFERFDGGGHLLFLESPGALQPARGGVPLLITRAAVLHEIGAERPYAASTPAHDRGARAGAAAGRRAASCASPRPGSATPTSRSSTARGRGRCRWCSATRQPGSSRPSGRESPTSRAGDHVVLSFVPSCGLCAECAGGEPILCGGGRGERRGRAARRRAPLLGGRQRAVHHHLGVSAFSERIVVARSLGRRRRSCRAARDRGALRLRGRHRRRRGAQHRRDVRPGDSVAVFGLGGVGLAAVMGAALAGAQPIVAIDPVEFKRELALELGATQRSTPTRSAPSASATPSRRRARPPCSKPPIARPRAAARPSRSASPIPRAS